MKCGEFKTALTKWLCFIGVCTLVCQVQAIPKTLSSLVGDTNLALDLTHTTEKIVLQATPLSSCSSDSDCISSCSCIDNFCRRVLESNAAIGNCYLCGHDSSYVCENSCALLSNYKPYGVCQSCRTNALQEGFNACPAKTNETDSELVFPGQKALNDTKSTNDASACFPAEAIVFLESGIVKRMDQINIGDKVEVGNGLFSEVFGFTHKEVSGNYEFLKVTLNNNKSISLTRGHYIYVNDQIKEARNIRNGDNLEDGNGDKLLVESIAIVKDHGLFNPQTIHGDIVVNGVKASTFTSTVKPEIANSLLSPIRAFFLLTGKTTPYLENVAGILC